MEKGETNYICKGVPGKKAPPEDGIKLIVDATGGYWTKVPKICKRDPL